MKKLFVFQDNHDEYRNELECAYDRVSHDKLRTDFGFLTVDYLIKNKIEVLITNGLPKEWYFTLRGLDIVTITLGNREKYCQYSDIVIDCFSNDDKRYFTGSNFSVCRNKNLEIEKIVDLITKLEWDSGFFGFNIAFLSCMHLTENIMRRIENFIRRENIRLVEYLCNCHDRTSVRIAEQNGFNFTDIRLTYKYVLKEKQEVGLNGLAFAKATEQDIPRLRILNKDIYKDSRYFFDGNFAIEKVHEFYPGWVEKSVRGQYDDQCCCLYDQNTPVAFCTLKFDRENSANIGLLGVDPEYQGKGLGKKILYSVFNLLIDKGIQQFFVVTQGRNYAAQILYQATGFRTESTQLWYHKWI
jgi:dTDP-4-amino-4,6-dideoxy-D-galactose acyltransferase